MKRNWILYYLLFFQEIILPNLCNFEFFHLHKIKAIVRINNSIAQKLCTNQCLGHHERTPYSKFNHNHKTTNNPKPQWFSSSFSGNLVTKNVKQFYLSLQKYKQQIKNLYLQESTQRNLTKILCLPWKIICIFKIKSSAEPEAII